MTKKEDKPNEPVSGIYEVLKGNQVRLWTHGWYCTCGGNPDNECEHITTARALYKIDKREPQEGSEE